ncbi:MAG: hypothetical protein ACTHMI_16420 [Mucilaginibacter sp.]
MKTNVIYKLGGLLILSIIVSSFDDVKTLKGKWEYAGDIFNGKAEGAPTEYTLERRFTKDKFESFLLEKGEKPQKYEAGEYSLEADTCYQTQTFSAQDSQLLNIRIKYKYTLVNDTLTLSTTLPNGNKVTEFWKKK